MPTSRAGTSRTLQRGVTLVELLVVIMIMGVVGAVVLFSVPARISEAERAARELAGQVPALSDAAVTSGRTVGLDLREGRLMLLGYENDRWRETGGVPIGPDLRLDLSPADEVLPPDPPSEGQLIFYRPPGEEEEELPPPPPVLFSPTGEATPFSVRIEDEEAAWVVRVDAMAEAGVARAED
ncbi:type II secretion system minor pseudopilin GspH [Parvularcula oceani]|uniref:type II secretion system minor pseudopilin GspH n=1 Tax=Parvularcula oceani TaxID=1247963 RepID=UPI00138E0A8E|nr:type II secretion system minor pseudopilin GspH [Parvularcula oceani]